MDFSFPLRAYFLDLVFAWNDAIDPIFRMSSVG